MKIDEFEAILKEQAEKYFKLAEQARQGSEVQKLFRGVEQGLIAARVAYQSWKANGEHIPTKDR